MLKLKATTLLFFAIFLSVQIFAQDSERWNIPVTKLKPTGEVVNQVQPTKPDFQFNNNPIRTVFTDRTYTVYPNVIPVPNPGGTQSEIHIAIDPVNTQNILVGSNGANTAVTYLNQGWYMTTNGGTSWYGNDSLPLAPSGYYRSDPVIAWDLFGSAYFNTLEYSSSAGDLVTLKTTNKGQTWTKVAVPNPGPDEDKNWIAIDNNTNSPYKNYIYTAYTEFGSSDANYRRLEYSRSTDLGATFSAPVNISGTAGYLDQGCNVAVGPNGEVYWIWTKYVSSALTTSNIGFNKSTDGGATWAGATLITPVINDIRGNLTKGGNSIRVNSFPYVAVDRSNGPRRGWIYVTYAARAVTGQAPDVYLTISTNGGTSWSTPKRVNADSALTNRDQWFPAAAVDPADGSLNIVYYDSRNFAANDSAEVYLSRSIDGGMTFEDIKISTSAHKPQSISGLATGYQGDYIGIDAKNGVVWPAWNDNRTGRHQTYVAKVFFIQINHTKLGNTENLAGPYRVDAVIKGSLPITTAKVFWRRGTTGTYNELAMTRVATSDSFYANIPGNNTSSVYQYYIYAQDQGGAFATLPGGAPADVFEFTAATDNVPPVVTHTVLPDQYRELWSPTVTATVTDNIGVDSVRVNYKINTNGILRQFYLTKSTTEADGYSGTFNIDSSLLKVGDTVYYRITARDKANTPNYGYHPSQTGWNSFKMIADVTFPVIAHNSLKDQPKLRWPSTIIANVTDNMKVDSVWVEWYKNTTANSKRFNLAKQPGTDTWSGPFNSDTFQVAVGDSIFYRVVARDGSTNKNITYLPPTGRFKFNIIATKGLVLVIDDDVTLAARVSSEKGGEPVSENDSPLGASANIFKTTLDSVGYSADLVTFAAFDTTVLANYDIVILSAGSKSSSLFADQGKRDAIRNFASKTGKKTWVEGGEVGYFFRSTGTQDALFRAQVLHCSTWVSDASSSTLTIKDPAHPINNGVVGPLAFSSTSIYARDAMRVEPGQRAYPVVGFSAYPDSGGIIVYDKNPNPSGADGVFYSFNVSLVTDQAMVQKLIANTADYLVNQEAPPTGGISGTVTLTGAPNNSGARVKLSFKATPTAYIDSVTTGNAGTYTFSGLYPGNYRVTVFPPSGYIPASQFKDTTVATAVVSNVNFTFTTALPTTLQGTVTVQGAPDNSGVVVTVVGQAGKTATTNAAGSYSITNILAGPITVTFQKQGFRTVTKDTTIANGQTMTINVTMVPGTMALVIDDDAVLAHRINPEREDLGEKADLTTPLGASATLIKTALEEAGFVVDLVTFAAFDTTVLNNYTLVALSAGTKTSTIFNDAGKRTALVNWASKANNKVIVEGGEVGYFFRGTTPDQNFRDNLLHVNSWVTDATSSTLNLKIPSHPINVGVPDNLALSGTSYGFRDGMRVQPGTITYPTNTWSAVPDTGGIIVYDKTPSPVSADAVFMSFAVSGLTDQDAAKKLIKNVGTYLNTAEAAPTGSIAGVVTMTGAPNNAGAKVYLSKTAAPSVYLDSITTGNSGGYAFNALYAGNYRVTVFPPTGFTPASQFKDTVVGTAPVVNVNFTFQQIVSTTLTGTVTVTGAPNNGGVVVTITNQPGKTATTATNGTYTITGVTPGPINVTFVKTGYKTVTKDTTIANGQTLTLNVTMVAGTNEIFLDFEANNGGFTPTNDWAWGTATKAGAPIAYSGVKLWATKLDVNYTNGIKSELKSAPINLAGFTNVTLSFWHWYNIESKTGDTTSWDGGNVKVSTDNGATWNLVTPAGGYPMRIDVTTNPMNGERVFAGIKEFWQVAEFNLNAYANKTILVRFDFGTDPSVNRTGWFIDDLKIEDRLLLMAPKNLTATSGQNKRISLAWQAPTAVDRPLPAQDPLMSLSAPEVMEKQAQEKFNISPVAPVINTQTDNPEGFLGYKIYRKSIFSATYGTAYATVGTTTTTYNDTLVTNDSMYNYIVKAYYDEGESGATNEVRAAAYVKSDTILFTKSTVTPTLDGTLNTAEWAEAKVTNLTLNGIGGKMWAKYDTVSRIIHIGVINYADKTVENYDQIGIYFDRDYSKSWSNDSLAEGNYWIARIGDTTAVIFRGIYGTTPSYTQQYMNPAGVRAKIGKTGDFISYEVSINTALASFNTLPGNWAGVYAYCANGTGTSSTNTGLWPETAVFSNPATFGSIKLPGSLAPVTAGFSTAAGWNLISVPLRQTNMSKGSLFPTSSSNAFTYQDAVGYSKVDTLIHGNGYWLKFNSTANHSFTAVPVFTLDVPVVAGWNLIGALHSQFPVASITSNPSGLIVSSVYEYTGGSYNVATNLDKGKGYWVRVNAPGTLKIGASTLLAKGGNTYVETIDEGWPTIVITDAEGHTAKLYLSSNTSLQGRYDLPPMPMNGISDVRFASNKYVDDLSNITRAINLNSMTYPVTVRIENSDQNFRIKDLIDGSIVNNRLFKGNDVVINNPAVNVINLSNDVLPTKFDLGQNYPNPFNPATRISFALPENSVVRLEVYNLLGEKVATLVNGALEAGYHYVNFDASKLSSGIYVYRIDAGNFSAVKKMMMVK